MESTRIAFTCCYLLFVATISAETCEKSKCPGPIGYYEALSCTPVYHSPEDCCPYKYNCDDLYSRSREKCYINGGKEYKIGEMLKEEDSNPCDIGCVCRNGVDNVAVFNCAIVDCFHGPIKPGYPLDPDKNCVCQEGYAGENVEPFCVKPKHPYCSPEMRHASDIHNHCAPVYYSTQSPQTSCSVFSRCQNSKDEVIKNEASTSDSDMTCTFGNFTMNAGDELNQATDYSSVCVKCVCEVGPLPTCQRLPDEECDISSINSQIIMELTRTLLTSFFSLLILEILADEDCDKSKCPGPIKYYKDIKCKPVYNSPEDCCPYKYNCDHLQARSPKKCYINNHEYEIGDRLRNEDADPCSKGCFCSDRRDIATFTCAIVDCFTGHSSNPNCYRRRQANRCCPGEEVCPEKAEDIPTCEVDGKIYKDGEYFKPASEPHKNCYCGPGYIGENVEPFCITPVDICRTELKYAHNIISNCTMALTRSFFFGILCLSLTIPSLIADEECDASKCPGPLKYYEDVKCKPVYKTPDSCCPYKFDCDHLKERSKETCMPEDIPTCQIDGKIYKDGEYFKPTAEPNKNCYCAPGYTGENIEPFCKIATNVCGAELYHAYEIHNDCVPVYYNSQSPQSSCSFAYRCQNKHDSVIKRLKTLEDLENTQMDSTCKFGDLTMQYGDELIQSTDYSSVCVKCVCEVGPVPTCQRLPDSECDVTKHPPFNV
ncbi:Protein of unknown function, partial [Cotesia congregata]